MVGVTLWLGTPMGLGTLYGWGHSLVGDTNGVGDTINLGPLYGWGHSMGGDTVVGDTL